MNDNQIISNIASVSYKGYNGNISQIYSNRVFTEITCNQSGCDKPSCDKPTCDKPTCDKPTCDKPICDKPTCDRPSYNEETYNGSSYNNCTRSNEIICDLCIDGCTCIPVHTCCPFKILKITPVVTTSFYRDNCNNTFLKVALTQYIYYLVIGSSKPKCVYSTKSKCYPMLLGENLYSIDSEVTNIKYCLNSNNEVNSATTVTLTLKYN